MAGTIRLTEIIIFTEMEWGNNVWGEKPRFGTGTIALKQSFRLFFSPSRDRQVEKVISQKVHINIVKEAVIITSKAKAIIYCPGWSGLRRFSNLLWPLSQDQSKQGLKSKRCTVKIPVAPMLIFGIAT